MFAYLLACLLTCLLIACDCACDCPQARVAKTCDTEASLGTGTTRHLLATGNPAPQKYP